MPRNAMDQMFVMFDDLKESQIILNDDSRNILKMGDESWYYSEEADVTIVVCVEANSPFMFSMVKIFLKKMLKML